MLTLECINQEIMPGGRLGVCMELALVYIEAGEQNLSCVHVLLKI